ncbi:hypothetical protein K461DRAFT_97213 [Myriangium duriaei CBS 260.36]|uniref:Uncharacterized protein n=1 Tax=Myriangium duriaei CBS 260.36 TaxID=1168546 RepID=A0A9P4J855_9PEZI|nr:hypothetical protein K461DRAFT_97213 [Myriangium duriaei CBS 260.36]
MSSFSQAVVLIVGSERSFAGGMVSFQIKHHYRRWLFITECDVVAHAHEVDAACTREVAKCDTNRRQRAMIRRRSSNAGSGYHKRQAHVASSGYSTCLGFFGVDHKLNFRGRDPGSRQANGPLPIRPPQPVPQWSPDPGLSTHEC